jgi:uncharacterized protein YndB with AHSA1/START domain
MPTPNTVITITSDLPVSAARAFALISDPGELGHWFAEEVSIDRRVGGAFSFAGRGAYAPVATQLTHFVDGSAMGWTWPLLGVSGAVMMTITPGEEAEASRIEVTCDFPELPPVVRARELIDDLWRFHVGNLKTHAEGAPGVFLPDFSDPAPEVRQSVHIAAARPAVFRALVDPAMLAQWTFGTPSVDARTGGAYSYGWSYEIDGKPVAGGPTKIIDYVENERLVTDWPDWRGDDSNSGQQITWLLADDGDGTRLTLIHSGFSRASDISDFPFGWSGFLELIDAAVVGASA